MNKLRLLLLLFIAMLASVLTNAQSIAGPSVLCVGTPANYFGTPSGGTWSCSSAIATIADASIPGDGVALAHGISAGICTFTYTLPSSAYGTITVTVGIPPTPGVVTGVDTICIGGSTTFSSTASGGGWSSSNAAIAMVTSAGVVTGTAAGITTISHSIISGGCQASGTHSITVLPMVSITPSGTANVCVGNTISLAGTVPGGTWSSSDASKATVSSTGVVMGVALGWVAIIYTLPTGCSAHASVFVSGALAAITGPTTLCDGTSITLTDASPGGTWVSSSPIYASIGSATGMVVGVAAGTSTISYVVSGGCVATTVVTVMPYAVISPGSGAAICTGGTAAFSGTPSGGVWTYAGSGISMTGSVVTGVAAGVSTVTYTSPAGCSSTTLVTVNPLPTAITGITSICNGASTTLMCTSTGGIWTSDVITVAPIDAFTGVATGIAPGTTTISYTLSTGCRSTTVLTVIPGAAITGGSTSVCAGSSVTFTGSPSGGTWSTASSGISVSGGVVTGITAGAAVVTYSSGGCSSILMVTVMPLPAAITGTASVCTGSTTTLMSATPGGVWTSSVPLMGSVDAATGVVTGIAAGTTTITYTLPTGCYTTTIVTVNPGAAITGGGTTVCAGSTVTLSGSPSGGTWSTASSGISVTGGVVTGVSTGAAVVTYSSGGCSTTTTVTVMPVPAAITGTASVCAGNSTTLMCVTSGGTWSSSVPGTGSVDAAGVATGIAAGTTTITYTLPTGCYATVVLSVNALPGVSASATAATCGNSYAMAASGAVTYEWSPASGLSCTACSSPVATPGSTTVYTVAGTSAAGCTGTAMVTISIDRVYGHITFSSTAPSVPALKVWLIQFNPSDSSITSTDSVTSCTDAGVEYFQFDSKPAGNYLVKAKLLSAVPATSDYIPTYGASTANWYSAATIAHTAGGVDMQDISMIYGTVPAGPGFISGYVYSGAGKGTAGDIPVEGMMIYLKNTSSNVLTYTYTNASGVFTFPSLAYGSYVIYPEEQSYYTTPSDVITLSAEMPGYDVANFRQYTTTGVIKPIVATTSTFTTAANAGVNVFPNPATGMVNIQSAELAGGIARLTLTDVTGRTALSATIEMDAKGNTRADLSGIAPGVYIIRLTAAHTSYTGKLMID